MTFNVFGGTLNLIQLLNQQADGQSVSTKPSPPIVGSGDIKLELRMKI